METYRRFLSGEEKKLIKEKKLGVRVCCTADYLGNHLVKYGIYMEPTMQYIREFWTWIDGFDKIHLIDDGAIQSMKSDDRWLKEGRENAWKDEEV